MRFGTHDTHRIQQRDITLVVICSIGVQLYTIIFDRNFGETRSLGLPEHTGEEVEIVLHVVVFVVLEQIGILGVIVLHPLTAVRIIAFVTAGCADKIERTFVGAIRTALIACDILVFVYSHFLAVGDSAEDRRQTIRINRPMTSYVWSCP